MEMNLQEVDLSIEPEIMKKVLLGKIVNFSIEQIKSFIPDKKEVGKGSWGTVYEGIIKGLSGYYIGLNDKKVAVKVGMHFCNESDFPTDDNYIQWQSEILLLTQIDHDSVIKLLGVCRTNLGLYLVYPLYEKGDLQKNIPNLNWERSLNVILKVAETMKILHWNAMIICRGIKPSDILLDENWNPVWTDFGRMMRFGDRLKGSHVFENEDLMFEGHLDHVYHNDYYSMGILMLSILMKEQEAYFEVKVTNRMKAEKWETDIEYSSKLKDCAEKMKEKISHVVHPEFLQTGCELQMAKRISDLAFACLAEGGVNRPTADELFKDFKELVNAPPADVGSSSKRRKYN